jgi:hypothetical protein
MVPFWLAIAGHAIGVMSGFLLGLTVGLAIAG